MLLDEADMADEVEKRRDEPRWVLVLHSDHTRMERAGAVHYKRGIGDSAGDVLVR